MNIYESNMYSEVYSFLKLLGEEYINKIPKKLFEYIKKERDEGFTIDINKDINEQISQKSIVFIALLNLDYWADENERQKLISLYKQNEINEEILKKQKYNPDNLFKRNNYIKEVTNPKKDIIEYKQSFIISIKKIINKILKRDKKE